MQALSGPDTAGRKGNDATGQFGYGAVVEDGSTAEPQQKLQKSKRFKIILSILAIAILATGVALIFVFHHKEKTPAEQFEEYKLKFNKQYTKEEAVTAFQAFKENIKEIKALNDLKGAKFGWNRFTDMDMSEFRAKYLGRDVPTSSQRAKMNIKAAPLTSDGPSVTKLDWEALGAVTPVRDQGWCGSCWAYATVATIESRYILDNGVTDVENFELSVQQMVSCDKNGWNAGCNGGDPPGAFDWITNNGGLSHADDYPYTSYEGETGSCTDNVEVLDGTNVASWGYATDECYSNSCNNLDEEKMAKSVEDYGPITVCVNANMWQFYESGVFTDDQCGRNGYWALNHCVALTGFDLDASTPYWTLKNSWDTTWGEAGYMRVEYGTNTCGVAVEAIYAELE